MTLLTQALYYTSNISRSVSGIHFVNEAVLCANPKRLYEKKAMAMVPGIAIFTIIPYCARRSCDCG